jgi:hypothetical protein
MVYRSCAQQGWPTGTSRIARSPYIALHFMTGYLFVYGTYTQVPNAYSKLREERNCQVTIFCAYQTYGRLLKSCRSRGLVRKRYNHQANRSARSPHTVRFVRLMVSDMCTQVSMAHSKHRKERVRQEAIGCTLQIYNCVQMCIQAPWPDFNNYSA